MANNEQKNNNPNPSTPNAPSTTSPADAGKEGGSKDGNWKAPPETNVQNTNVQPAVMPGITPPAPVVQPVLTPATMQPQAHGPIVIPQQPGMPAPIIPKTVQGVSYPNDRVTDPNNPLVSAEAAKEQADLAGKIGTIADPSANLAPAQPSNTKK